MITDWAALQQARLKALAGTRVDSWRGTEMAFETADEAKPVWRHSSVNAIQFTCLDVQTGDSWQRFTAHPGEDPASDNGIIVWEAPTQMEPVDPATTIFRNVLLSSLPTGDIASVSLDTDSYGMVGCVHLRIGADIVSLQAAEVYDDGQGGFRIVPHDDSILVQLNNQCPEVG